MSNIFKSVKKEIEKQYGRGDATSLRLISTGAAMIDSLPFKFDIDNVGEASDKGLCVAISGDAVNDGSFKANEIELSGMIKGRQTVIKKKLSFVQKKDGKFILQAKLQDVRLESGLLEEKDEEKAFMQKLKRQLHFRLVPSYKGEQDTEIMLTVYPYANILDGAVSKWINVCSDEASLVKYL